MIGPVARKFVKNFIHNRISSKKYPQLASIEVTRQCNSKCSFCPIGVEKPELKGKDMSTAQIKDILDQFDAMGIIAFSFLGGEPTLRKDLVEIADYATEKNIISQLTTNGLLLKKQAKELTRAMDVIVVSLDSDNAKGYNDLRGVDGFDMVVDRVGRDTEKFRKFLAGKKKGGSGHDDTSKRGNRGVPGLLA